jgi:hypothetical protein
MKHSAAELRAKAQSYRQEVAQKLEQKRASAEQAKSPSAVSLFLAIASASKN